MGERTIYTIGRQFGSGGRQVGKALAERLGIPYYDKERAFPQCGRKACFISALLSCDGKLPDVLWHSRIQ